MLELPFSIRSGDGLADDERAVTEVAGYIIIFALVVSAITFVVVSGMSSLQETREAEQAANAERAFDVIHHNMGIVHERNAPSRSTEIDLAGAELFWASNVSITVRGDGDRLARYELRPVELRVSSDQSFVYEAGAVFSDHRDGGRIVNEPPFLISNERVHIPIIKTTADGFESATGSTVLLRGKSTDRAVIEDGTSYDTVTLEISSPRYELWADHLEEKYSLDCSLDDSTETADCETTGNPEIVYVTKQQIELSLIF